MLRMNFEDRVKIRKEKLEADKKIRDSRSAKDQLKELDRRLGKGIGAAKERERLQLSIKQQENQKENVKKNKKDKFENKLKTKV